jgi:hypothetical protein
LLLKPGDTVRIVGTAPVTLVPAGVAYESLGNSVSDRYLGKATMCAYFGIHEAELRRTHRKERDGYESFSNSLGSYKSFNSIEVEVVK